MLEVFPRGTLSTEYLVSLDGRQITTVSTVAPTSFVLDGHRYRLSSPEYAEERVALVKQFVQRLVSGDSYRLQAEGKEELLAEAQPSGLLPGGFRVRSEGREYQLEWDRRARRYQITRDGVPLGWIGGQRRLSRRLQGELAAELSLPLQLFLVWLVLTLREIVHPE